MRNFANARFGLTRRGLLQRCSAVTALGVLKPWRDAARLTHLLAAEHHVSREQEGFGVEPLDPATVRALALRAVDAARSAGAKYADVRLTRTLTQAAGGSLDLHFEDKEVIGIGVRALVDGAWGFAASSDWADDEVVRVAQAAVAQAKVNAVGVTRPIELTPVPIATGSWVMPVREDPFLISFETKLNLIQATTEAARQRLPRRSRAGGQFDIDLMAISCYRQERVFATTEGTFVTQTVYRTGGGLALTLFNARGFEIAAAPAEGLETAGRGWEIFDDARLVDQVPAMLDAAEADAILPVKPVDVGQYDIVCDAATTANLMNATLGRATALDYALGYEANAGGTSYLGPNPMTWLGQMVASPLVTVSANRSLEGGVATVNWDDDGVVPSDVPLIVAGRLMDYQTTRDLAGDLSDWYAQQHHPAQSHGCANSEDALSIALPMTPNLALAPSPSGPTLDAMVTGLGKGLAFVDGKASTDFQAKTGTLAGRVYEINRGKKVARINTGAVLFTTPGLWKNVTAIGGPTTVAHRAQLEIKGQPGQATMHTVSGAAATFKSQAVIDVTRKA